MFNKGDSFETDHSSINALLGKGSEFEGKLVFEGTVRIDGDFKGQIESNANLIIGENACVKAEITVNNIIISGEVEGNIHSKGKCEIHAPGKVVGNIKTPSLIIEEGVIFDGTCSMLENTGNIHKLPKSQKKDDPSKSEDDEKDMLEIKDKKN
ncbi:MAG: polymer-forming cytoskeletal protein [Pseudomonadota bacterium]